MVGTWFWPVGAGLPTQTSFDFRIKKQNLPPTMDSQTIASQQALLRISEGISDAAERERFLKHTVEPFTALLAAYRDPQRSKPIEWSKVRSGG